MRKEIDMTTYLKRNQYNWFHTFADPTYGFNVDIDVDKVVRLSKERKDSFFPYFFFLLMRGINAIDEMRLREVDGKVYLYDEIDPTFTIMTECGVYQNGGMKMEWDFGKFYTGIKEVINRVKTLTPGDDIDMFPICKEPNCVYTTCIPILSIEGMNHPTPMNNHDSASIPRVCWDKYRLKEDGHYHVTLNITVSHTLVDGYPLGRCFKHIQEEANKAEEIFIK